MMLLCLQTNTGYGYTHVIDNTVRAERILQGLCPDCGKDIKDHTLVCPTEYNNRIQKLKNAIVVQSLVNEFYKVKDSKAICST